jgi:Na+-transporting NADH:ubiquinone oxidoreductase subunit C
MPRDDTRIILFAAIVCVVCSLLLSATAAVLKTKQDRNAETDRKMNVLQAFGIEVRNEKGKKLLDADDVDEYFLNHISEIVLKADTGEVIPELTSKGLTRSELKEKTRLPLYLWSENEEVVKYAFPISGRGLWSTVNGYLALDKDLATVVGVTFYKHGETPGLGAECSEPWFMNQFAGKKVWEDGELLPFEVVKNGVLSRYPDGCDYCVDGITAATITSNGIMNFIRSDMKAYNKYFATIRGS